MRLDERRDATQVTLDTFRGATFDWSTLTCVHIAHSHLISMGHKLPKIPAFRTPQGAVRAMHKHGWSTVSDMLDQFLEPIAPAMMLVGDLAVVDGQDGLEAILISAGPLKLMGWHPDTSDFVLYDGGISRVKRAWRA